MDREAEIAADTPKAQHEQLSAPTMINPSAARVSMRKRVAVNHAIAEHIFAAS